MIFRAAQVKTFILRRTLKPRTGAAETRSLLSPSPTSFTPSVIEWIMVHRPEIALGLCVKRRVKTWQLSADNPQGRPLGRIPAALTASDVDG